jgi:uncharacterized protein with FMN-binding domain
VKVTPWLVAGGTIAGLAAVLSYHTAALPAAAVGGSALTAPGPRAAQRPSPSPSGVAANPNRARNSPAAATVTRTAQGPAEQFGYGQLDVEATVRGDRIVSVTVPSLQTAEPTSQQISEQAIGMLTSEVLSAQSLHVDAVSGATYTSDAYAQSLQAALDKLHFR